MWGGIALNDEMLLRFCSGDPCARIQNSYLHLLSTMDKPKALNCINSYCESKLPFAIVTKPLANLSDSDEVRLDGNELQLRRHRFTDALTPQFATNFRKTTLAYSYANLLTINNQWVDEVEARCLCGMLFFSLIFLYDRPIEHMRNRLIQWLVPTSECMSGNLTSIYYIRAYTEETFLYKDVNLALATNDHRTMRCLREYIKKCIKAFASKLIPFFTGTLYRGVQMTDNELVQYKVGEGIRFLGFISTSKSLDLVRFLGTNIIFIIHTLTVQQQERLDTYTNADLHTSKISVMPAEEEVLYAPFSTFDIKSIDVCENGKVTYIILQENDTSAAEHTFLRYMQEHADKGSTEDWIMIEQHIIDINK